MIARGTATPAHCLPFIPPCLAQTAAKPPSGNDWVHEIKYDGYRVQAHIENGHVRLLTRNGHDWTARFGQVANDIRALAVRSAVIDGEAIVQDAAGVADFAALTSELKSGRSSRIAFMAFDLLHVDGADLRDRPLLARKAALNSILSGAVRLVRFSNHMAGDGSAILGKACAIGVEGIVSKRVDKPYRSGRGGDWVKAKCVMADPFVIIGYVPSTATIDAVGSLVLGYYDGPQLIYAGRVGTGFTAAAAAKLWQSLQPMRIAAPALASTLDRTQRAGVVWVKPALVARIEYRAWTDDRLLRHATYKGLRADKEAREIGAPSSQRFA